MHTAKNPYRLTHSWQMLRQEIARVVKQTCSLCPPTQHFAQCVYQMAALYQGVADTGGTPAKHKALLTHEHKRLASNKWGALAGRPANEA